MYTNIYILKHDILVYSIYIYIYVLPKKTCFMAQYGPGVSGLYFIMCKHQLKFQFFSTYIYIYNMRHTIISCFAVKGFISLIYSMQMRKDTVVSSGYILIYIFTFFHLGPLIQRIL